MAYGDHPQDETLQAAWKQFCQQLEKAGELVFKDHNPATDLHRADAFRFLTQNLGQAFDLALETKNTQYPALHPFCTPTRKLGGDAADFLYLQAWIDGESVYKISGNRGTARFINFTVQGERPEKIPGTDIPSLHDPFGDIPEANLFGQQLKTEWDGSFELYIGGPERGPNWLPTTPKSRKLFLRQGFDSWDELPAAMSIERIGMHSPKPMPTPETMLEAMDWAGTFVEALMQDWPDNPYQYSPFVDPINVNAFPPDPSDNDESDTKRGRAVAHMCWELQADEALIIEIDNLKSFWMLSNAGSFMNSFDYLYRTASYTPARSAIDDDGKVRFVLCKDDPGYHNWMDTQGLQRGNITYRNLQSQAVTSFKTQLVKQQDLNKVMPAESKTVSPEERQQQLKQRFDSIRRRYCI